MSIPDSVAPSTTPIPARKARAAVTVSGARFWMLLDFVCMGLAGVQGAWLSPYFSWGELNQEITVTVSLYVGFFVLLGVGSGLYDRGRRFRLSSVLAAGAVVAILAGLCTLVSSYALLFLVIGRFTILYVSLSAAVAFVALRYVLSRLVRSTPHRFALIGKPTSAARIAREFRKGQYSHIEAVSLSSGLPTVSQLLEGEIAEVILCRSSREDPATTELALDAIRFGIRVSEEDLRYAELFDQLPPEQLDTAMLLRLGISAPHGIESLFKRAGDILFSLILLVALSPLLLLTAMLVKLTSPGPILYTQLRQGRYLKPFKIYKFRTMRAKSDQSITTTLVADHRVTRIGRWIRPLHIDELPQLWNVLRGEMSLIGPRPEVLEFTHRIRQTLPIYDFRHLMRPGLSGLAQVNMGYTGESEADTRSKLSFDLYYILRFSLALDIQIALKTLFRLARSSR